jgi:hypothetical protein
MEEEDEVVMGRGRWDGEGVMGRGRWGGEGEIYSVTT